MQIQFISIPVFKNLHDISVDTSSHKGLTVLIGNNASGKSNFLEALSELFYNRYNNDSSSLAYSVRYVDIAGKDITVAGDDEYPSSDLPKRVVAVYSGEEDRLWKTYYEDFYKKYIDDILGDKAVSYPQMIYLNKYYWHISLLCLLCSSASDVRSFIENNLGIEEPVSIRFRKGSPQRKNSTVSQFVDALKDSAYSVVEFQELLNNSEISSTELFYNLYIAFTPKDHKLLEDIVITFNGSQTIADLSEGQKKQLLIKAALEFAAQEDSLFLLDEPDAHVHVSNKKAILDIVDEYRDKRHIIITTHSPKLCHACLELPIPAGVLKLEDGNCSSVSDIIGAARYLADSDEIMRLLFSSKDILIVEGKTDEKYISKACLLFQTEFPTLSFEFLRVGGSDFENVKALLDAIAPPTNRRIIVVSDRDDAGRNVYKNLFSGAATNLAEIDWKPVPSRSNVYYLMIPNGEGKPAENFLIEDYFPKDRVRELINTFLDGKLVGRIPLKKFPDIGGYLKAEALPAFCDATQTTDTTAMNGFKMLLAKLAEIVAQPLQ